MCFVFPCSFFFFNDPATTEIYTLSLHDALPISSGERVAHGAQSVALPGGSRLNEERGRRQLPVTPPARRSEEHTSELQSLRHLVCRLLLEKKKKKKHKQKEHNKR